MWATLNYMVFLGKLNYVVFLGTLNYVVFLGIEIKLCGVSW